MNLRVITIIAVSVLMLIAVIITALAEIDGRKKKTSTAGC